MVKGLDNWVTSCRVEDPGIDPRVVLEARNGSIFVQLGNWNLSQARDVAHQINQICDEAEAEFAQPARKTANNRKGLKS